VCLPEACLTCPPEQLLGRLLCGRGWGEWPERLALKWKKKDGTAGYVKGGKFAETSYCLDFLVPKLRFGNQTLKHMAAPLLG